MTHTSRTWVEIDRAALEHNFSQLKAIAQQKILAPVIKGNAYGHGLLEVGRVCQESPNVDWLCVALLSEALTLRKAGVSKPILVLVYLDDNVHLAIEHDIDVVVYAPEMLTVLSACAQKIKKPCRVHIKIDTGLSRLGIKPEQAIQFIKWAQNLPFIQAQGIATHFAESQAQDGKTMNTQINIFSHILAQLEKEQVQIPHQHICNSAAMIRLKHPPGTFFRPGLSIYGYYSSNYIQQIAQSIHPSLTLKPVMTWKSRIADIKTVPAQQPIGYGGTYQTSRESRLAMLPIGYADGYNEHFNDGIVLINNSSAPVVGTIGMNITIIDVTDVSDIQIGQEVYLVADQPGIRADQIAARSTKNPRKITTNIPPQISRILT